MVDSRRVAASITEAKAATEPQESGASSGSPDAGKQKSPVEPNRAKQTDDETNNNIRDAGTFLGHADELTSSTNHQASEREPPGSSIKRDSDSASGTGAGMQAPPGTCCAQSDAAGANSSAPSASRLAGESRGEKSTNRDEESALNETNRLLLLEGQTNLAANGCHQQQSQANINQVHQQQDFKLAPLLQNNNNNNSSNSQPVTCKQRQLSYLQVLLIRKWPYLALTICIMGALIFGILLSSLTVLLMHGQASHCVSSELAGSPGGVHSSPLLAPRELELPMSELAMSHLEQSDSSLSGAPGAGGGGGGGDSPMRAKSQQPTTTTTSRFQRLPTSVWPVHYDLFVQPYLYEPFNFTGKVLIRIKCTEATDNITLHALDLDLNASSIHLSELPPQSAQQQQPATRLAAAASIATQSGRPKVSSLSQDKQLQHSIIRLDGQLEPGKEYLLGIDFVGFLNDDLAGFYKIKYELKNSTTAAPTTTWIAATQFQATDARRAFPCFDEPLYKATFSIKIKHWKNMTSLSNMPIVDRQDSADGQWVTDVFEKSHRMSTYLVAFAVTNFESRSEGNISVWTRPGFAHTAEYSLRIAGKLLRYYEDFFGIEYPLPKMDMIALPDFNAGAMENWGLITYRETSMLFDESGSSIANKQRIATVVAHELAHQWFGNLVTPKWWDDLWLNEGFASYVEYIGVDKIEPSWKILDQFATEELQNVFRVDDLSSSHQISIPVNDPEEISEIFDHISYAKSASVIRMMHYFLTPDVFKTGLRRYLRALKYSNAEQSDLWAHLTEASKLLVGANASSIQQHQHQHHQQPEPVDVGKVMNSWTLQVGYPLVTLTRHYDGSQRAQLDQIRYRPTLEQQLQQRLAHKNGTLAAQKWEVPVTYTWKSERNFEPITRVWLHQNDSSPLELDRRMVPKSDDDWMLLNLGQVGYYRVNYDLQNWRLLIKQLQEDHLAIGTTNRAQLLDDIFELARSGSLDYKFALDSTKYLKSEKDFLPWDAVLTSFGYIDEMLQRTPLYGQWQDYVGDLIRPYYARYKDSMDWTVRGLEGANKLANNESDNALEQYNLVNAIGWACQVDQHCIAKARSLFGRWRDSGRNEINPVVRFTVYCTAIENGDKEDWDFLWRVYEREQNSSEKDRILKALSCSKQIWMLSRYLEWTFNKSKPIRRQDGAYIFRMIAKNNYGRDIAFNFVRERWTTIREHYGKTSFSLGALIRSLSYAMNTQIELNQLMNFYESVKSDVGTGKRSFQNAIEEVETNVQWRNRNYKILEDWLTEARASKL